MISAGDFRNGVTVEIDGNVCQIVEFQHVKPGKGAAFVRTKYKNIITGSVLEKSFRPTEKFPQARIDRVDMSYLYNDGDLYNFMNTETYDQVALTKEQVGDSLKFVKENEVVKVCSCDNIFIFCSYECSALSRFYMLELNDLTYISFNFNSDTVSEITCRNHFNILLLCVFATNYFIIYRKFFQLFFSYVDNFSSISLISSSNGTSPVTT